MGFPDYFKQTGPVLPQPERYVLVSIFQVHKTLKQSDIAFSDIYEKTKQKLNHKELVNALENLEEGGLITYKRVMGQDGFLSIRLTFDGKISAENSGQMTGGSQTKVVNTPIKGTLIRERFNIMCNSAEKFLNEILKIKNITHGKSFRAKIRAFQEKTQNIGIPTVDLTMTCNRMLSLDDEWTFAKHGDFVVNCIEEVCIKDGITKIYTTQHMEKIDNDFLEIQKDLMAVLNFLSKRT